MIRGATVACLVVVAACDSDTSRYESSIADTSWTTASDVPMAAVTEDVFVAGGATGAAWASFNRIYSAAFTATGDLAVLDIVQRRVVLVAPDGSRRHEVSRPGDGPGEYRQPVSLVTLGDERLVVYDRGHMSFLVFGPDGDFVDQAGIQVDIVSDMLRGLPDGRILAAAVAIDEPNRSLDLYSLDGTRETFYAAWNIPNEAEDLMLEEAQGAYRAIVNVKTPPEFAPPLLIDVLSDGRVALVDSTGYRIKLISPAGTIAGTLDKSIEPMDVTPAIEQAARDRRAGASISVLGADISEQARRALMRQLQDDAASRMTFAEQIPVINRMAVDSEDRVWVERTGRDGFSDGPTDVFDADGTYLGTLSTDGLRIPRAFGPDGLMAYIQRDELDSPVVRVIRLLALERVGDPSN